jgi:hypothetical protein
MERLVHKWNLHREHPWSIVAGALKIVASVEYVLLLLDFTVTMEITVCCGAGERLLGLIG